MNHRGKARENHTVRHAAYSSCCEGEILRFGEILNCARDLSFVRATARHFAVRLQAAGLDIDAVQNVRIPREFGGEVKRFQVLR